MRNLLLWALLFYNVLDWNTRTVSANYDRDYEDLEANKRHSVMDDRKGWRKKVVPKDPDHKEWDERNSRRHDFESQRYFDDNDRKGRLKDLDGPDPGYKLHNRRQYDDIDNIPLPKSSEFYEKENDYIKRLSKSEPEKKSSPAMNCDRVHERFESCFAGCAAVSCDNPRERLRPCYPFCEQGCICILPFVRDDRTHKCVMPEDCTKGLKGIPDLTSES